MRRPLTILAAATLVITAAACTSGESDDGDATARPEATSPAPDGTQSATSSPAAGPEGMPIAIEQAFPHLDFDRMVGLHWMPGEQDIAVVLTQHDGIVYRANLSDDSSEPTVFLDVSDKLIADPGNEEGLLGFAFAPDYETSREFYVYFSAGEPRRSVIERYRAEGDAADQDSARIIMEIEQPFQNHNGGALEFGPDGMLYIALGDGGLGGDPFGHGQNTETLLGSILRIDVAGGGAYTVPPDNPFVNGGGAPEIWAYGLRNPWRITFDRQTGDLWTGDVGQNEFEEINRVIRGGNYGWNTVEGPECFNPGENCDRTGLVEPRTWYGREDGISVTGGYVYRGEAMPQLDGWYVYGDFGSGKVWAVDASADMGDALLLMESERPIASFAEDPEGELYIVGFDNAIYRIVPGA
jgi:glucose/arabinose dehydrogenase